MSTPEQMDQVFHIIMQHMVATMNLFRSEEHIRNWRGFKPDTETGINRPADIVPFVLLAAGRAPDVRRVPA